MKKKVVVFLTICFMFAFVQQYFKRNSELADFVNSTLANIESLAQDEIGSDGCWLQPETKRCTLQLGGGWFTSSVERCVLCGSLFLHSCTMWRTILICNPL